MPILNVHLDGSMLDSARAGTFRLMAVLARTVQDAGWVVAWRHADEPADPEAYTLVHMRPPPTARSLVLRRAYHYPFWRIEPVAERWRFAVARARFDPAAIDPARAEAFRRHLAGRVLPGPPPRAGDRVLVPLQGQIRRERSFQTMSPIAMLRAVCATGLPVDATLHPREALSEADRAALGALQARHPRLTVGGNTAALLRDCAFVVTQNSAAAFDGFILGKPAVLFGQSDFHHIALNVAQMGLSAALHAAPSHAPDYAAYLFWFLRRRAIDASAVNAGERILRAMRQGGWPI